MILIENNHITAKTFRNHYGLKHFSNIKRGRLEQISEQYLTESVAKIIFINHYYGEPVNEQKRK